ncbi:hypothetical protein DSO57_1022374 [Entomophthora muscae]|uniref:Uncharacterized protein n=1 Tax=Entomophthora muscae TaxID=34485 RepID=A0ACC2UC59_9FUNG|nr:hypothetical protein DSO57_1022374 [Entomophthora muscae]
MQSILVCLLAAVGGIPITLDGSPLVRRSPTEGIHEFRLYNSLARREEMDPIMVEVLTTTLIEKIGDQLNKVLGKAKQLDGKGSEAEQRRKIAELESSINNIALEMSNEVLAKTESIKKEKYANDKKASTEDPSATDNSSPKSSSSFSSGGDKDNNSSSSSSSGDYSRPSLPNSNGDSKNSDSKSSSSSSNEDNTPKEVGNDSTTSASSKDSSKDQAYSGDKSFKDELKAEMKKMKEKMKEDMKKELKRRDEPKLTISKEEAATISKKVGDAVASRLPQEQQAEAPLVKAVATTITEQVMKDIAIAKS